MSVDLAGSLRYPFSRHPPRLVGYGWLVILEDSALRSGRLGLLALALLLPR